MHRIGRTGRAGLAGHAISFATPDQRRDVRDIEQLIRKALPVKSHSGRALPGQERPPYVAPRQPRQVDVAPPSRSESTVRTTRIISLEDEGSSERPRFGRRPPPRNFGNRRGGPPRRPQSSRR